MATNIEPLAELTSKFAQDPAATSHLARQSPSNPSPSDFDQQSPAVLKQWSPSNTRPEQFRKRPHANPLPSQFDSASSTADLYGYTTEGPASRAAPTEEHRAAVWNQTPAESPGQDGATPKPNEYASVLTRPHPIRTSSSNYVTACADALSPSSENPRGGNSFADDAIHEQTSRGTKSGGAAAVSASGPSRSPWGGSIDTNGVNESFPAKNSPLGSPSSATWRPTFFREQSWSTEDRKRSMHGRLMGNVEEDGGGYSSDEAARDHGKGHGR